MRKIFFDIETSNVFWEVGKYDPTLLDIAVVAIYDSDTESYSTYLKEELNELWPIIENADMLIGFNSDHFDVPLLNKYYPGDLSHTKSLDILREIRDQYGRRMKLDQLAEGTLGINKSGHGLEAIKWWKNGEVDKVKSYCIDDVKITKDIYDFARANNKLIFKEGGALNEVKLDTSLWEENLEKKLTFTLPF
jgi:DEAD/DEAH box helicase domain-containing protein